jgi:hypothetical protein
MGVFFDIAHTLGRLVWQMHKNDVSRDAPSFLLKISKNAPPSREMSKTTLSRSACTSGGPDWAGRTWSRAHFVKAISRQHDARHAWECVFCAQEPEPDFSPFLAKIPQPQL